MPQPMSSCDPGRSEAQTITSLDNNVMEVNVAWKALPSPKEVDLQAQAGLDQGVQRELVSCLSAEHAP